MLADFFSILLGTEYHDCPRESSLPEYNQELTHTTLTGQSPFIMVSWPFIRRASSGDEGYPA